MSFRLVLLTCREEAAKLAEEEEKKRKRAEKFGTLEPATADAAPVS